MSIPLAQLHPQDRPSKFGDKHNIPIMRTDIKAWDKAWEKALRMLSPSEEMYPMLGCMWDQDFHRAHQAGDVNLDAISNDMYKRACELQHGLVMVNGSINQDDSEYLVTAWMLLEEPERRRHLLNGMKAACDCTSFRLDARALCPEITTTAMLKRGGMAFIDFARELADGIKESGPDELYLLPSEWFRSAVKEPEPWSDKTKFIFKQLAIQRAVFISIYVLETLISILHDLKYSSPGMKRATDLLKTDSYMASTIAKALSSATLFLDKPLIRCQNCTKTPEEVGGNTMFMVCSNCKSKLNFRIHYCSKTCQKADWRTHKKHCGKEKVPKKLPHAIRGVDPPADGEPWPDEVEFGQPHPDHPHNAALQRQVSLLQNNVVVDYFLFDDLDRPVPFVVNDPQVKISFRAVRKRVLFGPGAPESRGVEFMAEHLIRKTIHLQGFSRERILAQLRREYDRDVAAEMVTFEASDFGSSLHPEATFIERMAVMSRGLVSRVSLHAPVRS